MTSNPALYDEVGKTYSQTRRADPRIAALVTDALDGMASVVNVGAGAGSYEPPQTIAAVDPSLTMLRQRPASAAPALLGVAESLPLRAKCADAAMAILTIHHWSDLEAGIAEMRRIARRRLVFLTWDPDRFRRFWLFAEYLPEATRVDADMAVPMQLLAGLLDQPRTVPVPVPSDCTDGFAAANWRHPERYLDPVVRAAISSMAKAGEDALAPGLARLAGDLDSGRWQFEHADLFQLDSLDVGYRLVIADA
jgi:SAM-dependent methyltransferase